MTNLNYVEASLFRRGSLLTRDDSTRTIFQSTALLLVFSDLHLFSLSKEVSFFNGCV